MIEFYKRRRDWIWTIFICFIIFWIGALNHSTDDMFRRGFLDSEMHAVNGTTELNGVGGVKLITNEENQQTDVETDQFALEEGTYTLKVEYEATAPGNTVTVFSKTAVDSNNNKGIILQQITLSEDENEVRVGVNSTRDYNDIQIHISTIKGELLINTLDIDGNQPIFIDALFMAFLLILGILIIKLAYRSIRERERLNTLLILSLIVGVSSLSLFSDYLILGHDLEIHLARIEGLYQGLINGNFPVRINPIQAEGYGYAMPIMYPDLFLLFPAALRMLGVSLMLSYKLFIMLQNVMTAVVAYCCGKKVFRSNSAGLLASVIYTLSAYRLIDIYERAAVGEILAITFLPLLFYGVYEIIAGNSNKWYWAGIGFAAIVESHVLSVIMVLFFMLLILVFSIQRLWKEKTRIVKGIFAATLAILLTAWTIIPMMDYMKLPFKVGDTSMSLHYSGVYLLQSLSMYWGGGVRRCLAPGQTMNEMPLTIGIILPVGLILFLYCVVIEKKYRERIYLYAITLGIIAFIMTMWIFPWDALQKVGKIAWVVSRLQYSFRFFMFANFFWTIPATVGIFAFVKNAESRKSLFIISLVIIVMTMPFLQGTLEKYNIRNKSMIVGIHKSDSLYEMPESSASSRKNIGEEIEVSDDAKVEISNITTKGVKRSFECKVANKTEESYVDLPVLYYPGYIAKCGDEILEVSSGDAGRLRISIPAQNGTIEVDFVEKPTWLIADIISLITALGLVICVVITAMKKKKSTKVLNGE